MSRLPLDLIDNVVHHLRGDAQSLLQCCQVSRAFLIRSRKALFSVISFDLAVYSTDLTTSPNYPYDDSKIDATQRRWNDLYGYLSTNPQYIACIEELWLKGLTWAIKEDTFPALLARLVDSQSLRVLSLAFSVGKQEGWHVMPAAISEPITALFRSPHLHTLRIHITDRCACTIPVSVFTEVAPSLKRLSIGGDSLFSFISGEFCPHQDVPEQMRPPVEKTIKLEVLEIGCLNTRRFRDFLLGPTSPYDLGGVKVVFVRSWADPDGLSEIIKMMEGSIESLVWFHPKAHNGAFVEATKLWSMKRLRSLVFIISELEHANAVFQMFKRGAIPDSLDEITIYIDDIIGVLQSDATQSSIDNDLGDVMAIYGRRNVRIVMLRRVMMLNERASAMMKRYFPRLSKEAKLWVGEEDMRAFECKMNAILSG